MSILPQIDNQIDNELTTIQIPSKTFKLTTDEDNEDRIIGFVDNLAAVQQTAQHILATERYAYPIYNDDYGVEFEQYIGSDYEYLEATIEETLRDALTYDLRMTEVEVTEINKIAVDAVKVKFTVTSIYGDLQMEVDVNV